jgi:hypothetical protein
VAQALVLSLELGVGLGPERVALELLELEAQPVGALGRESGARRERRQLAVDGLEPPRGLRHRRERHVVATEGVEQAQSCAGRSSSAWCSCWPWISISCSAS